MLFCFLDIGEWSRFINMITSATGEQINVTQLFNRWTEQNVKKEGNSTLDRSSDP